MGHAAGRKKGQQSLCIFCMAALMRTGIVQSQHQVHVSPNSADGGAVSGAPWWRQMNGIGDEMAHATTHSGIEFGLTTRISDFFRNLQDARRRYKVYRQTVNELENLTDRDLMDLGISRSMIESVATEAAYSK